MEEWKEYKVAEVIEDISMGPFGSNIKRDNYVDSGVPYLNGSNLSSFKLNEDSFYFVTEEKAKSLGRCVAKRGDIIVTHRGTIGQISYIPFDSKYEYYLTGNSQFRLTVNNKVIRPDFFVYYFHTRIGQHRLLANASQVGVPALARPTSTFKEVLVPVPKMEVQNKIMDILHSLDDKIEVNRRINDNLEQQAQALFKSWFVDFEPFKDQPFVKSELGMIPYGWKVYSMDELVEVVGGYSYKGSELQDSNIAMVTIKNFNRNGGFKTDGFKEIIPSPKAKSDQYLSKYDILIAHTDLTQNADIIGNPALLLNCCDYDRIIMSMDLVKVNSKIDSITYGLLYSIFADSRFKSHALGYVNGTTVLHLSKKSVPEYKIALPSELTKLNKYGLILNSLFEKESFIIDESRRLAELRDTLLPRLMSGELRVTNMDLVNKLMENHIF